MTRYELSLLQRVKEGVATLGEQLALLKVIEAGSKRRESNMVGEPLRKTSSGDPLNSFFVNREGSLRSSVSTGAQDQLGKSTRQRLEMGILPQEKRAVTHYTSDRPIDWGSAQQRDWQASGRHSATNFADADRWGDITASSSRGTTGKPVRDEVDERRGSVALPAKRTPGGHLDGAGSEHFNTRDLQDRAFAQLLDAIGYRRRTRTGALGGS